MSKIPGVGYNPVSGTVFWVWPGGASAPSTTFNPAAGDPFGTGPGGVLNREVFDARYGGRPVRPSDGTVGLFVLDAESLLGILTQAMELAAQEGRVPEFTGTTATHTMVPTLRESHDFAAIHADGGRFLLKDFIPDKPGQPKIEEISSPRPGHIQLSWVTKKATSFLIKAGSHEVSFPDPQQGNTRSTEIKLPPGMGGEIEVTVQAFQGGTPGKWSRPKRVKVEPAGVQPEDQHIQSIRQRVKGIETDLSAYQVPGTNKQALIRAIRRKLRACEAELKKLEEGL